MATIILPIVFDSAEKYFFFFFLNKLSWLLLVLD